MAFLYAESPKSSFISGKVEIVDPNKTGGDSISILEVNSTIPFGFIVATGKGSRIEAKDSPVTWRLGSLSVGKWISSNKFWLHSGSLLFCSDSNTSIVISTKGSTATFQGKGTVIIEATQNGGFKFIPLEGKGVISTIKGGGKKIIGGRLLLILENPSEFGNAYDIDLNLMLRSSRLINSFPDPLSSFPKIGLAIYIQELKLKGKYDALIGDATTNENLQLWKFAKNTGAEPSTSKSPESKKGFFKSFFGKE